MILTLLSSQTSHQRSKCTNYIVDNHIRQANRQTGTEQANNPATCQPTKPMTITYSKAIATTTRTQAAANWWWAFSPLARILGECSMIHSLPVLFFFFFFFFWKWSLAHAHFFHSLGQDWFMVAQRTETTGAECSLTSCM